MPTAAEAAAASPGPMAAALAAGVGVVSQNQTVTFTRYDRVLLPADGFAFWVRSDSLSPSGLINGAPINGMSIDAAQGITKAAPTITIKGSLHYTTTNNQDEAEGFSINRVIFTSESDVEELNTINPKSWYIAEFNGLRFGFFLRNRLYLQSGLFHYQGDAIYPSMATQIVEYPEQLDVRQVVSNSLPAWLTLNAFCPMYPSYLVPEDITPPWCAVHVEPQGTQGLQAAPWIDPDNGSHWQLTRDRVRLSFYGLRNFNAMSFIDYVNQFSLNTDTFGVMNIPITRDEKKTQAEMNILAQAKVVEYEVSYYQQAIRDRALQYITSAFATIIPTAGAPAPTPPQVNPHRFAFNNPVNSQYLGMLSGV